MNEELDRVVLSLKDDLFKAASEIIKFKSVEAPKDGDAPFGKGVKEALNYALEVGKKYGLNAKNVDNYAGHVEYGDSGKLFGVLGHLDVVPEGDGWDVDPYGGIIKDGYLWGRGSIDDKGPMMAALFALIAVKKAGIAPKSRVRVIFGTNEETGWKGLEYYFKREEMPQWGVTPDADFPIINCEKGIVNFEISAKRAKSSVVSIQGGEASNMVASHAKAIIKTKDKNLVKKLNDFVPKNGAKISAQYKNGEVIVETFGKSAHGSKPEEGVNAIAALMDFLVHAHLADESVKLLNEKIGYEPDGKSLGIAGMDNASGKLTLNLGTIEADEENIKMVINIRYPIFFNVEMIESQIKAALKNMQVEMQHHQKPLYVSPDSDLIKLLSQVYEDVTHQKAYLISIGGGTYARAIPNAVAFGPLFPGRESLEHQPNERIKLDDLLMVSRIYAQLLYKVLS